MNIEQGIRTRFFQEMERILKTDPYYQKARGGSEYGRKLFAEKILWTNQNLYAAEAGKRDIPKRILANLAIIYGTDLNWLILGVNKSVNKQGEKQPK